MAVITVDQSGSALLSNAYIATFGTRKIGQSFSTNGQSQPLRLNNWQFYMRKIGTVSGSFTIALRQHSGTYGTSSVPGPVIRSLTYQTTNIAQDTATWRTWSVAGFNDVLQPNTNYIVEIHYPSGDVNNCLQILSSNQPGPAGNAYIDVNGSVTPLANDDLVFVVTGSEYVDQGQPGRLRVQPQQGPIPSSAFTGAYSSGFGGALGFGNAGFGMASIQGFFIRDKDQTGRLSVFGQNTKNQTGRLRISQIIERDIQGTLRIQDTFDQPIEGLLRVTGEPVRLQTGRLRIQQTYDQDISGALKVAGPIDRHQEGQLRISKIWDRNQPGRLRIWTTTERTQSGRLRVYKITSRDQTGQLRVSKIVERTQLGRLRVGLISDKSLTGAMSIFNPVIEGGGIYVPDWKPGGEFEPALIEDVGIIIPQPRSNGTFEDISELETGLLIPQPIQTGKF